jgi:hypothetical protein
VVACARVRLGAVPLLADIPLHTMWLPPIPTKRPTPSEYAVIAFVICSALIVFGAIALVVAFRAPPEKHDAAMELMRYGAWSFGSGVFAGIAFWLVRRLTH